MSAPHPPMAVSSHRPWTSTLGHGALPVPSSLMGASRGGRRAEQEPRGHPAPEPVRCPHGGGKVADRHEDTGPAVGTGVPHGMARAELPLLTCSIGGGSFPSRPGFLAPAPKLAKCPVPRTSCGILKTSSSPDGSLRLPKGGQGLVVDSRCWQEGPAGTSRETGPGQARPPPPRAERVSLRDVRLLPFAADACLLGFAPCGSTTRAGPELPRGQSQAGGPGRGWATGHWD